MLFSLLIVNKSGGLVYHTHLSESRVLRDKSTNEMMRIGSMFFSTSAIVGQVSPTKGGGGGILELEADTFALYCLHTPTGMKFITTCEHGEAAQAVAKRFLAAVYRAYADFALKNPAYTIDQPIRIDRFARAVTDAAAEETARR